MANTVKSIQYLNKDFGSFRKSLIDFAKIYFPSTYTDFNESDPGMMFIEMAAMVGDVLSYYTDRQLRESLITHADEKANIFAIANAMGYKAKNSISAQTKLDIFQLVPAKGSGTSTSPDYSYALTIDEGMIVSSTSDADITFRTEEIVDFSYSSSLDTTVVNVYQINDVTKIPEYYLLKKSVKAISGELVTATYEFESPKIYDKIILDDTDVISIVDVTDSDSNNWYEVPYLAQDTIFQDIQNVITNDPDLYINREQAPYLLKLVKTSRRFVKRLRSDRKFELQFGAGVSTDYDEELTPTPDNVGSALPGIVKNIDTSLDPSNYLYTQTYGLAPSSTTLTVRYLKGGGVNENLVSDDLQTIDAVSSSFINTGLNTAMETLVTDSLRCTNPEAAFGGKSEEPVDEIRNNTLALFAAQNRIVTKEDYIIRAYSLPPKFGSIAKAYVVQDDQLDPENRDERISNPFALNLYVLGYNKDKKLSALNAATKENLKTYITAFRMLTDAVNIKNAFIINIGLDFEIITLAEYNSNEVLLNCIHELRNYFNVDKWQINQPVIKSELYNLLNSVDGVKSVPKITITNLFESDLGYSGNLYDIKSATKNGVIYPSKDPSIFEVKYLNKDLRGKVVSF